MSAELSTSLDPLPDTEIPRSIKRSEAWFRALMEQSPLSTQVFSPAGRTIQVNRAWERLWGATLQDVATYNILEDPQLIECGIMPYIRRGFAGEALAIPAVWYDPNDTLPKITSRSDPRRWVRAFIHPIKDEEDRITEIVLIHEDMTEQKLAELARQEVEQRFGRFMQNLPGLAWSKDVHGRYVYANDAALQAFGATPEQLFGRTDDEVFPPETAAQFKRNDSRAWDASPGVQVVEQLVHPDGTLHHSLVAKFPIPNASGEPALVGGIAIDVTAVKRAEEELRKGEHRLRLALEAGRMGVWEWTFSTNQVWWSDNLESIHGLAPGSFGGTLADFEAILHPEDRLLVHSAIQQAIESRGDYEIDFRIVWPDGSIHWMAGKGKVFCDDAGTPQRMVGVGMDVTERRNAEDALRSADRRKDEFLATLAHELRNPLAPIRNGLEILNSPGIQPDAAADAREMMQRQLAQMVHLIDDLLDLSRITRGRLELRLGMVTIAEVIQNAVETSQPLIDAHQHELILTMPAKTIYLVADKTRLAQVVANLLTNSAKYMDDGGKIWLTVEQHSPELSITVKDKGIGITADQLPHVFEMFSQVKGALERAQGGLGIGLALVRGLVEMHGGSVSATSAGLGQGSEFAIRLPMSTIDRGPEPVEARPPIRGPALRSRILVVDDNRDGAASLATMLRTAGAEVRTAYDGWDAIEQAEVFRPHVILMDLGMPRLNGFEACRKIRETEWGRSLKIIAVSGFAQEEDQRKAREAGFDGHFVKPVGFQTLVAALERIGGNSC